MGKRQPSATTIHSIQLLRFLAAALVSMFLAQKTFASGISKPFFDQENYLFGFGAVGVHIFFVISGFIMVYTSFSPGQNYNARQFFKRRLVRIYPIYWICALTYITVHAAIYQPFNLSLKEYFSALLLWPTHASAVIGPAWTLPYELFFYLCFGLAMMLSLNRGLLALSIVFIGLIGLGALMPERSPVVLVITNSILLEFLAGAAIGWLTVSGRLPLKWGVALVMIGVVLFLFGINFGYDTLPTAIIWGLPSAVLILGLISVEISGGAPPAVRRLGRLGDSSYMLYLIHILFITLAVEFSAHFLEASLIPPPAIAATIITIVAIAAAEVGHRSIEKPLLARLRPQRAPLASQG